MTTSRILTERSQEELNKAIIQYLTNTLDDNQKPILKDLSNILHVEETDQIVANYLEKKWSTVIRLQKKIMDLENEVTSLRTIVDAQQQNSSTTNGIIRRDRINWLPVSSGNNFQTEPGQLILSVKLHPILPIIFSGISDGSIIIWKIVNDNISIPDKIIQAHARGVNKLAWSSEPVDFSSSSSAASDSKYYALASCSADLSIKIWNGSNYRHIRTLTGHEHTVSSIVFSPTNPVILYSVSRDNTLKVWNLIDGNCLKSIVGHSDWVRDIDVASINSTISLSNIKESNDVGLGDFVITCSNDQSIRLTHATTGTGLSMLIGHTHVIETVKFLPITSNFILDKYLKNHASEYPNIPQDILSNPVYTETLGFKYCISGGRDNLIKLFLIPPPTISDEGKTVTPTKYNGGMGWEIATIPGHVAWVKTLAVHPNGKFIFSGSEDKTIRVWDLNNLNIEGKIKCIKTLQGHEGFINTIDFAKYTLNKSEFPNFKNEEEFQIELLKQIEVNMKCLFISGGTDSTVNLWN
ncbi:WD40-repeat-containing domain protein [Scheffersomyces coipomensis]|uniref:WD40-repeat-containing domain protein n=1 Tax=Scheffersomyces coipomensis TaxID=1788519 RepID=UPI00315DBFA4